MSEVNFNVRLETKRKNANGYMPLHQYAANWLFPDTSDEERARLEAHLADAIARVAEMNGLGNNDVMHIFPLILRMLKSNSEWAK